MLSGQGSNIWRLVAGAAALALLGLTEFALLVFVAYGSSGAALALCLTPIIFMVRTPRTLSFLTLSAALLALVPSLSIALQLAQPSTATVARACCRDGEWFDIAPLTPERVAINAGVIGVALFGAIFCAMFLWKRVAMTTQRPATLTA